MQTVSQAINLMADQTRARQSIVWLGMTAIALLSAPDRFSTLDGFLLVIASVLGALMLANLHQARKLEDPKRSLTHLTIALGSALVAVIISMSMHLLSGLVLLIVLGLLAYLSEHRPFVTAAITVVTVPWWIWIAVDSWRWQLLMLVPIVALALMAISHLMDTHTWPEGEERLLPERAHRSAAWLLIAIAGIAIIAVGLLTDVGRPWLALAGIVLAAAIPLEAGVGIDGSGSARPGIRVVASAFLVAMCCWLIGIS